MTAQALIAAGIRPDTAAALERWCFFYDVPLAAGAVITTLETTDGANIYGHDVGACMSAPRGVTIEGPQQTYAQYLA